MSTGQRAVCICSGGLDSTVLVYQAKAAYDETIMVSFNYGQRHNRELEYAARTAERLGVEHRVLSMAWMAYILHGSALTERGPDVPEGHYAEPSMKQTVVPNRNMIMLSIASGIAVAEKFTTVMTAVHAGDHFIYPDCKPDFIDAVNRAVQLGNRGFADIDVYAPYVNITKADIVKLGAQYDVNWQDTYSCYNGRELHCGVCGTCTERKEAFDLAGVKDPTDYEQ